MRDLLSTFCFDAGALSGKDISEIIREGLPFDATRMVCDVPLRVSGQFRPDVHLSILEAAETVPALELTTAAEDEGPALFVATIEPWRLQTISWKLPDYEEPNPAVIESLIRKPGFNAGYMADAQDTFWQSEERVETYELLGRSHRDLPKIPDPIFGGYKIDILRNPGARYLFPGMWLQAAWKMWFSGRTFAVISKQHLLQFQDAEQVKELDNGVVFIQLYKHPGDYDSTDARRRQEAFRDWIDLVTLASNAEAYGAVSADPAFEIHEGAFERGGVRLVVIWLDERGNPVRRSQATKKLVRELDSDGRTIWSSEIYLDEHD